MTALKAVTFEGWSGGEYGDYHPREAGRMKEMFGGNNVVRNRDAVMVPRAGMKALGITGLENGNIKAGGFGADGMWLLIDNTIYYFNTAVGATATAYTMTDSVSDTIIYPYESAGFLTGSYLMAYGGNAYKLDHVGHTCALVAGSDPVPAGRTVTFYQDRLFVGGTASFPSRLFFSEPGAGSPGWDDFPSGNYLDIPDLGAITFLGKYRTGLMVGGSNGRFQYITGVVGFTTQSRGVTDQGAPADPTKGATLATNEILYMATNRPYVETFNGALHEPMPHLTVAARNFVADSGREPKFKTLKGIGADDWLWVSGLDGTYSFAAQQRALLHYEGVATYHTWEKTIRSWVWHEGAGRHILAEDGDGSTPPKLYVWTTELDRPGFTSDVDATVGDGSDTTPIAARLWTPQFFPEDGSNTRVHQVIVDFRKWNTGSTATNHFDVSVQTVNRYSTVDASVTDALASTAQSFDEAGSATVPAVTGGGVDQRRVFHFNENVGSGFEIHFDSIRGVGIRSATVLYEPEPPRS